MALSDPLQLVMIAVIVLVLFVFGPQKIPEIARSIGKARKEFESASKEFQQITKELQNPTAIIDRFTTEPQQATPAVQPVAAQPAATTTQTTSGATPPSPTQPKTGDQILIETAEKLGISTSGKTREQISEEITSKVKGA